MDGSGAGGQGTGREAWPAHQATVLVEVYENGEAAPQVQFPKESSLDMQDRSQVIDAVTESRRVPTGPFGDAELRPSRGPTG